VIRRAGRAEKVITLLLLFILLTAATAGVTAVLTGPDWASLWVSLLLGLLVGWGLAIFRRPAWWSVVLIMTVGLLFSLLFAGGLDEKVWAVFGELLRQAGRVISTLRTREIDLASLSRLIGQVFTAAGVVLERVYFWLKDLVIGQPSFDPVAAGFVWSTVVWLVAAWAGWVAESGRNALVAVLPALLLNLTTLSYGRNNSTSIYLMLGITLILIAVVQYDQREQEWNQTKVAYPSRKSREVGNAALLIAILLVVFSAIISSFSLQRIIDWTSDVSRSAGQSESGLAKSLGIIPAATATPDAFTNIRSPGLPRQLLIGSGAELSTEQVMSVEVRDLTGLIQDGLLPPLYWRSFIYDIYTDHGWSSSSTVQSEYQPDQQFQPDQLPGHILITQVVNVVPGQGGTIYAAGEPVRANVASLAAWRTSTDLFGIQTGNNAYELQSLIPVVDESSLRKAGQAYPSWIVQRYLALPAEVTARVKALALQLTATEPTPYDRARTIEQYLRKFPYSLEVPYPPANQDLVDYFLFDLGKGYCDYYASAMVVLSRAAGIPARLVVGYASGTYNLNSKRFIVTQADAHSWVEVYFPSIGWVPFEPTAGLPAINRTGQPTSVVIPTTPAPTTPVSGGLTINLGKYIGYGIFGVITAMGFSWAILDELNLRRLKPQAAAMEIYHRLRRYGVLLKAPTELGETPFEFASSLISRIQEITRQGFAAGAGLTTSSQAEMLIGQIVRLSYRPTETKIASRSGIIYAWRSLRWRMRLMWVADIMKSARRLLQTRSDRQAEKPQIPVEEE
jgi:transglutaminase-like putative cysteine protease